MEEFLKTREVLKNPEKYLGKEIKVRGWIRNSRFSKNVGFLEITDGSHFNNLQLVVGSDVKNFEEISKYTLSTSLEAKGILVENKGGKQDVELQIKEIVLIQKADEDYPLQKKKHTMEYLRTIAHLRPRANIFKAVFKIRSVAAIAVHEFFNNNGFTHVHAPIITSSDAEGAGDMFNLSSKPLHEIAQLGDKFDYKDTFFGKSAFLSVSGQLGAEAFALSFGDVYTFGPTFRAEDSHTTKHAAEFWMIEPEMAFADLNKNMDVAEAMVKHIIKKVFEEAKEELEFLNKNVDEGLIEKLENVRDSEFARCTYTEAVEKLIESKEKFEFKVEWGIDLQTEHERYLSEKIYGKPVFVTDYPKDIKAFYMKENEDKKTVAAMDLLVPGIGELIGGSQREDDLEKLENKIEEFGLNKEEYWWYLELRKYGTVPHSGYGLGFERMIMYLTGMKNIRDVIPFHRTPGSCDF